MDRVSVYLSTRLLENQGIIGQLIFNTGLIAEHQDIHITELGYSIIQCNITKNSNDKCEYNQIRLHILALLCRLQI
jgi:hypothetical protein